MAFDRLTAYVRTAKTLAESQYRCLKVSVSDLRSKGVEASDQVEVTALQRKTRLELILLSCAVCGIEFCYSAETAFVSPTLLKIGIPMTYMSLVWCLSPLLGLVLGPMLGLMSDRCTSRLGRRRPFILILSVGIVVGLSMVPNGKGIGKRLGDADLYAGCKCSNLSINTSSHQLMMQDLISKADSQVEAYTAQSVAKQHYSLMSHKNAKPPRMQPNSIFLKMQSSPSQNADRKLFKTEGNNRVDSNNTKLLTSQVIRNEGLKHEILGFNSSAAISVEESKHSQFEERATTNQVDQHGTIHKVRSTDDDYARCEDSGTSFTTADDSSDHCFTIRRPLFGILITVLGVVLLDSCCDACQSPCRAYLLDVSIPEDHASGLSTFTIMAGIGGSVGYLLGGVNWEQTHLEHDLGDHVRIVFTVVTIVYIASVLLTVTSVAEIPIDRYKETAEDRQRKRMTINAKRYEKFLNESSDEEIREENSLRMNGKNRSALYGTNSTSNGPQTLTDSNSNCDPEDLSTTNRGASNVNSAKTIFDTSDLSDISFTTYMRSFFRMPRSIAALCLTNFFCWLSLICYSLYFTDFVGQSVLNGNPYAPAWSQVHKRYDQGVRLGSIGMSMYSLSCSVYSLNIKKLVNRFGKSGSGFEIFICELILQCALTPIMINLNKLILLHVKVILFA